MTSTMNSYSQLSNRCVWITYAKMHKI